MGKRLIVLSVAMMLFTLAQGQQVESKKCKTCGKPLKECPYKGKHHTGTTPAQKQSEIEKQKKRQIEQRAREEEQDRLLQSVIEGVRFEGRDLVFVVDGKECRYKMIYVEGGGFWMGEQSKDSSLANYDPDAYEGSGPVHKENVVSFYIGQTEVTQALWKAVMNNEPSLDGGCTHIDGRGPDYPVYHIKERDIMAFIDKLNQLTGCNFRLPTIEEWEYAARGGLYNQGNLYSGCNDEKSLEQYAWYGKNSAGKNHPVAKKKPNELNLYDMCGNVLELTSSLARCTGCSKDEPLSKGGDHNSEAHGCRNAGASFCSSGSILGFRLVMTR